MRPDDADEYETEFWDAEGQYTVKGYRGYLRSSLDDVAYLWGDVGVGDPQEVSFPGNLQYSHLHSKYLMAFNDSTEQTALAAATSGFNSWETKSLAFCHKAKWSCAHPHLMEESELRMINSK